MKLIIFDKANKPSPHMHIANTIADNEPIIGYPFVLTPICTPKRKYFIIEPAYATTDLNNLHMTEVWKDSIRPYTQTAQIEYHLHLGDTITIITDFETYKTDKIAGTVATINPGDSIPYKLWND